MANQVIEVITPNKLRTRVEQLHKQRCRLVQICCTRKEGLEIVYSFDDQLQLINLKMVIEEDTPIESISPVYSFAFLYENEMADLFGVKVNNMTVDFGGNLYKTSVKAPFRS